MELRLGGYGIPRSRYRLLRAFCLQYDDLRKAAADLMTRSSGSLTPPRGNETGDPVFSAVLRRERVIHDLHLIESTAQETAGGKWYAVLIANCCRGIALDKIQDFEKPTAKRATYYHVRREFFFRLNQKLDTRGAVKT